MSNITDQKSTKTQKTYHFAMPDNVITALRNRAKINHRTTTGELLSILEFSLQDELQRELIAETAGEKPMTKPLTTDVWRD